MLSAAIALRIVMAAAGAPRPALSAEVVPVDAACSPASRPCFVTAAITVRNDFLVTMTVDSIDIVLSRDWSSFHRVFDPPLAVAAGAKASTPDLFELHGEGHHELRLGYHADGEPRGSRRARVRIMSEHWLAEAAFAACLRCNGDNREACLCTTSDGGKRCREPAQCQGVCLFDDFEEIPPPACVPRPHRACSAWLRDGFRVGHCSGLKTPIGCLDVLTDQDSAARNILLSAARTRRCFEQAARVEPARAAPARVAPARVAPAPATGSSRRR